MGEGLNLIAVSPYGKCFIQSLGVESGWLQGTVEISPFRERDTEKERDGERGSVCIGGFWGVHWECIQVTDVIPSVTCHILPSV